jgi:hypothetical protein
MWMGLVGQACASAGKVQKTLMRPSSKAAMLIFFTVLVPVEC